MAEFPSKVSTHTSSPSQPGLGTYSLGIVSLDVGLIKSFFGILMITEIVLGLLVWALIAGSYYERHPEYGWVMFVTVLFWLLTIILFVIYVLRLYNKLPMVPWPIVLWAFNTVATILYVTAFLTCAASVDPTSPRGSPNYNRRAAASFFACIVMIAYGASTFFSFQAWRGGGSNAATMTFSSQATGTIHA
ncbi:plasmolipin [Latimeria chalumnae]|uniref:Plasmolipin n=1 Tax=Latimeria chalumnae TaxID=7897 RepID=H3AZU7_LATCH|nr:PREDICTED: plasmolipin [Latimeria chalumnae]|eukprot:XP_005997249.1 PREDICTED: plasmolipin [Latimeria chalumnae]